MTLNESFAAQSLGDPDQSACVQLLVGDLHYRLELLDGQAAIHAGDGPHDVAIAIDAGAADAIRDGQLTVADAIRNGQVQVTGRSDVLIAAARPLGELLQNLPPSS